MPPTVYTETQLLQTGPGDLMIDEDIDEDELLKSDQDDDFYAVPVKRKLFQLQGSNFVSE